MRTCTFLGPTTCSTSKYFEDYLGLHFRLCPRWIGALDVLIWSYWINMHEVKRSWPGNHRNIHDLDAVKQKKSCTGNASIHITTNN